MAKRTFGREFKLQVTRPLVRGEKRLAQICREYGLCQTLVRRWREQYEAQYACRDYVAVLEGAQARISMAAKGTPRDNAQAESFLRTLKHEEVYLQEYATFAEAEPSLGRFIERVYNEKRLHSSLGYRPPSEFEQLLAAELL